MKFTLNLLTCLAAMSFASTAIADDAKPKPDAKPTVEKKEEALPVTDPRSDDLKKLGKELAANPDDTKVHHKYMIGHLNIIRAMSVKDVKKVKAIVAIMQAEVKAIAPTTEKGKTSHKRMTTYLPRVAKDFVANAKRAAQRAAALAKLIGKDATPLNAESWVNGKSLTDADLKGKVVLLDFWAVWCTPCIRTLPHLAKLHKKYSDKGLVIIGATRYYGIKWDEKKNDISRGRSVPPVTPKEEKEMLVKFAEKYKIHHRIMLTPKGSKLARSYLATGLPTLVVIDQQGKVQLVKIGSGPATTNAIDAMLEKLLDKKSTTDTTTEK